MDCCLRVDACFITILFPFLLQRCSAYGLIPSDVRNRYRNLMNKTSAKKAKNELKKRKAGEHRVDQLQRLVDHRQQSKVAGYHVDVPVAGTPVSRTSTISTIQQSESKYYQPKLMKVHARNPEADVRLELAIAHLILSKGLPFDTGECSAMKNVIEAAREASSSFTCPNRKKVLGPLLDESYAMHQSQVMERLHNIIIWKKILKEISIFFNQQSGHVQRMFETV